MYGRFPTHEGIALPSSELCLPPSHLDDELPSNYNNHHLSWTRNAFGRLAIFQTLRDLDALQEPMLLDQHDQLHRDYSPPRLPTPKQALSFIHDQYDQGGQLRYRSLYRPEYMPITDSLIDQLHKEYNEVK